jgi:hypothetical protein
VTKAAPPRLGLATLALLVAGAAPAPAVAMTVVRYATHLHSEADNTGHPAHDRDSTVAATLGPGYLRIDEPDGSVIYDFVKHRLLRLDLATHTFTDGSLYEDVGFRAIELRNRVALGHAPDAGKIAKNPLTVLLDEHATGLSAESGTADIAVHHRAHERVFSTGTERLYAISDDSAPLSEEAQRPFWRFVRYYLSGHPAIYERIVEGTGAPRRLERRLQGAGASTLTLKLVEVTSIDDAPYALDGWQSATASSEPAATVAALGPTPGAKVADYVAATRAQRDAAAADQKLLNALLANLELLFVGDEQEALTAWLKDHHDAIDADTEAKSVLQTFSAATPADHLAAASTLETVRAVDPAHRYLLDVLASNHLASAGQPAEAIERMLRVLHAHPLMVGPWTDLGGMYLTQFDTHAAWICWDVARAIQPSHPMVAGINRFEEILRARGAAYF